MASATTAQFSRLITLSIAMAAFLLASYLSCNLWLRTATGLPATARSPSAN
jgi:Flp pilus assembly protein CpaB